MARSLDLFTYFSQAKIVIEQIFGGVVRKPGPRITQIKAADLRIANATEFESKIRSVANEGATVSFAHAVRGYIVGAGFARS